MSAMKITIIEWTYNKNSKIMELREIKKKIKVKYKRELDSYYCNFRNAEIPLKLEYIKNKFLNLINYENSFIPFLAFDFEIDRIDDISKPHESIKRITENLEQSKDLVKERDSEKIKFIKAEQEKDTKAMKEHLTRIESLEGKILEIKPPKEYIIKACAMPMSIRSWYIQNLKRILSKHSGFLDKYGNIIAMILFLVFGVVLSYIVISQGGKVNAENIQVIINNLPNAIAEGIKKGITENTVTTIPRMIPP